MRHNHIVSLKLKYNHADVFTVGLLHCRNIRQEIGNYYPDPEPRYYQVPRYFFTVLTVEQNQWYRATLEYAGEAAYRVVLQGRAIVIKSDTSNRFLRPGMSDNGGYWPESVCEQTKQVLFLFLYSYSYKERL